MEGENVEGMTALRLQQTQLTGAGDGFGAALHLQFVEDAAVVPFDRVQGEEQPLADLPVRESLGDQLQDVPARVGSVARRSADGRSADGGWWRWPLGLRRTQPGVCPRNRSNA